LLLGGGRASVDRDPPSLRAALDRGDARDAVTIVVTTSAVPVNPDTAFIQDVMASYTAHEPALVYCRKIVVCDKEYVRKKDDYRAGRVTEEAASAYNEYKRRLELLCEVAKEDATHPFFRAEVLVLEERHGFGPAVRRALTLVKTPYVMVVQHDRRAVQPFALCDILKGLESFRMRHVNYVCLGTRATWNNALRALSEFNLDMRDHMIELAPGSDWRIVPLPFWYDSTHVCRTSFYRDMAMRPHIVSVNPLLRWRWKTGEFIEDKLGQILRRQVKKYGLSALLRFGTFLLTHKNDESMLYDKSVRCGTRNEAYYDKHFFQYQNQTSSELKTIASFSESDAQNNVLRPSEADTSDEISGSDDEEDATTLLPRPPPEARQIDSTLVGRVKGRDVCKHYGSWTAERKLHVVVVHVNQRKVQTISKIYQASPSSNTQALGS